MLLKSNHIKNMSRNLAGKEGVKEKMIRSNLLSLHRDNGELLCLDPCPSWVWPFHIGHDRARGNKTFSSGCSCIPFNAHSFRLCIKDKSLKKDLNTGEKVVSFSIWKEGMTESAVH